MRTVDTIIIGGGQAGLAMSRSLRDRGIEHVILERGRLGERWRSERWDSLRLLTPRWQARLPGWRYEGPDPDGFMTRTEVIEYLERYAASFEAPVETGVEVLRVDRDCPGEGFCITTDSGNWSSANVVIATGDCDVPFVPDVAERLAPSVTQVVPTRYKRPDDLPDGGVLVVGASATGIQLAAEIHASGRPVTLSVGRHTRLPRSYRGKDIMWWLERMGVWDERAEEVRDLASSREQPSLQLIGSDDHRTLDLGVLGRGGIRLVGRTQAIDGTAVHFDDDLLESTVASDIKLARLRMRIDRYVRDAGLEDVVGAPDPFDRIVPPEAPRRLDLEAEGIRSVLWATGFVRRYPWLEVPVLDERGEIRHRGGVTAVPGLFVLGLRFLRRRSSSFIDGQAQDAEELAEHLAVRRRRLDTRGALCGWTG